MSFLFIWRDFGHRQHNICWGSRWNAAICIFPFLLFNVYNTCPLKEYFVSNMESRSYMCVPNNKLQ
jgi:hypothetical protein